ncbi:hypothetical protein EJP45_15475, partial [Escherichia coli]|nr:hypothetical protein [Escherichia coli]
LIHNLKCNFKNNTLKNIHYKTPKENQTTKTLAQRRFANVIILFFINFHYLYHKQDCNNG